MLDKVKKVVLVLSGKGGVGKDRNVQKISKKNFLTPKFVSN